ncbi:unnamed protein product [Urochloa decumbens]|uniref:Bifunctional inhibitor/plant lipid transfer protein/seed storage helical domain-containing protein n=1 Tax=Urochloa decumbens TaxID=240449 RepID=A0ABC8X0D1_9POAL
MAAKKAAVVAAVMALALVAAMGASAQQCNAGELAVCAPAIIGGAAPTAGCCSNLRSQEGCFCQYARNPAYSRYINSPSARSTLKSCGIAIPSC